MKTILAVILFGLSVSIYSQTDSIITYNDSVYSLDSVDSLPEFPGGEEALLGFIQHNYQIPCFAECFNVKVIVTFIIEKNGSLTDVKIASTKIYGDGFEEEAVRVVKLLPDFSKPAKINNQPVRVSFRLPIRICLK